MVFDGIRGAIFLYDNSNNLVGSWAISAGVDDFGHPYPQGLSVNIGTFTLGGGAVTINNQGIFIYSGTPALNNLIVSAASAAGTDAVGNNYPLGLAVYLTVAGNRNTIALNQSAPSGQGGISMYFTAPNGPTITGGVYGSASGSGGGIVFMQSGAGNSDSMATTFALSQVQSGGVPHGLVQDAAGISQAQGWLEIDGPFGGMTVVPPILINNRGILIAPNANGLPSVKCGTDNNLYIPGVTTRVPGLITINTTTATAVLTFLNLVANQWYHYRYMIYYTCSTSAGNPNFAIGGSQLGTLGGVVGKGGYYGNGTPETNVTLMNGALANFPGPVMVAAGLFVFELEGDIMSTTGGSLVLFASTSNVANPYTIAVGSFVRIMPTSN